MFYGFIIPSALAWLWITAGAVTSLVLRIFGGPTGYDLLPPGDFGPDLDLPPSPHPCPFGDCSIPKYFEFDGKIIIFDLDDVV